MLPFAKTTNKWLFNWVVGLTCAMLTQASMADTLNLASLVVKENHLHQWQVQLRLSHPTADTRKATLEFPNHCQSNRPIQQTTANRVTQTVWHLVCQQNTQLTWIKLRQLSDSQTQITLQQINREGESSLTTHANHDRALALNYFTNKEHKPLATDRVYQEATFFKQGFIHLMAGYDHIAFIILLGLLVTRLKQLIWTVTAFTMGHSVTLLLAALNYLPKASFLAPPFVEVLIALSILLLAIEVLKQRNTLTRRFPAVIAFGFGLIHGLGFAILLIELLQAQYITALDRVVPIALFNLGIECGQLIIVIGVFYLKHWYSRFRATEIEKVVSYGLGSIACYWLLMRLMTS